MKEVEKNDLQIDVKENIGHKVDSDKDESDEKIGLEKEADTYATDIEMECRVCREGDEDGTNPLYAPCLCSGSILFCHEGCLVEWLNRSGKDYCEVCKKKYVFEPKYAPNTPERLPATMILRGICRAVLTKISPYALRFLLSLATWLIVMPCLTASLYRFLVFTYKPPVVHTSRLRNDENKSSILMKYLMFCYNDAVAGLLLTGLIFVSFIIMMSFGDFLRSYWRLNTQQRQQRQQRQERQRRQHIRGHARDPINNGLADVNRRMEHHDRRPNLEEIEADIIRNIENRALERRLGHNVNIENVGVGVGGDEEEWNVAMEQDRSMNNNEFMPDINAQENRRDVPAVRRPDQSNRSNVSASSVKIIQPSVLTPAPPLSSQDDYKLPTSSSHDNSRKAQMAGRLNIWEEFEIPSEEQLRSKGHFGQSFAESNKCDGGQDDDVNNTGHIKDLLEYELRWAERERQCTDNCLNDSEEKSLSSHSQADDSDSSGEYDDESEDEDDVHIDHEDDQDDQGPIDGILEAFGVGLEMEVVVDGGADAALLNDEAEERERLRVLQVEEARRELERAQHEEAMEFLAEHGVFDDRDPAMRNAANGERANPQMPEHRVPNGDIGAGAGAEGLELRLNLEELLGLTGPISTMLRCLAWVILFNSIFILIGYSIPSFFGFLAAQKPVRLVEGIFNFVSLGHPNALVWFFSAGRWSSMSALQNSLSSSFLDLLNHIPPSVLQYLTHLKDWCSALHISYLSFLNRAALTHNLITFPDVLRVVLGYLVFVVDSFLVSRLCALIPRNPGRRISRKISLLLQLVAATADILKIGVLLGIRIFSLPCVIGFVIYSCWNNIFLGIETEKLIEFFIHNVIGTVGIFWGMGISFMLYSTIAVLQLREILHPIFLARYIRPQESQSDLLSSLLQDSATTQLKRVFVSFLVYCLLILAFIHIPLISIRALGNACVQTCAYLGLPWAEQMGESAMSIFEIRTHYFAPELQVPLEVGLLHTAFLLFLEKFKDVVGFVEFNVIVNLSKMLGLNRFLLPYSYKKICGLSPRVQGYNDLPQRKKDFYREREVLQVDGFLVAVCAEPMLRPPAGWDARVSESSTRWAWNDDDVQALEKSVLPNVYPGKAVIGEDSRDTSKDSSFTRFALYWFNIFVHHPWFAARLFTFISICWCIAVAGSVFPVLFPFFLGRTLFFAFRLPNMFCHDPFAYFVGNFVLQILIKECEHLTGKIGRLMMMVWNWRRQRLGDGGDTSTDSADRSCTTTLSQATLRLSKEACVMFVMSFVVLPVSFGLVHFGFRQFRPIVTLMEVSKMLFFGNKTCEVGEDKSCLSSSNSIMSDNDQVWYFAEEVLRLYLIGLLMYFTIVFFVLSRGWKRLLAKVGIEVLRADSEGPPSDQEAVESNSMLKQASFAQLVKNFEWEIDEFIAAFVRNSPGTVIHDHLSYQPPTSVTHLTTEDFVSHWANVVQKYNSAFSFAPSLLALCRRIVTSFLVAFLLNIAWLNAIGSRSAEVGDHDTMLLLPFHFSVAFNIILPLLVVSSCLVTLDESISLFHHSQRWWNKICDKIHKSIKEDLFLIGMQLQNSVEGMKHIAKLGASRY